MSEFILPDLPYDLEALEPFMDAKTLEVHHGGHHATYVKNLNAALEGHNDLKNKSINELLDHLDQLPKKLQTAVQNNGGGHFSHSLFWEVMSPKGGGEPTTHIAKGIDKYFKNFNNFQKELSTAAISRFGSGYGGS